MSTFYTTTGLRRRLLLLVFIPLIWTGCLYIFQRPADTRTKGNVEIVMEEPLGNWRFDAQLAEDCPAEADSLRTSVTGDKVFAIRSSYFHTVLARQGFTMLLVTLAIILFHDGLRLLFRRRGMRQS